MPRRRLKGGKKYKTQEEFNQAIVSFLTLFRDRAIAYIDEPDFNVNIFADRIEVAIDAIYNMEKENSPEFILNDDLSEWVNEILSQLVDEADKRKPGIAKVFDLRRITEKFDTTDDPNLRRENLLEDVNKKTVKLLEKFEFNEFQKHDEYDYIFWVSGSTRPGMERVNLISYFILPKDDEETDGLSHRVTIICRDDGLIYYNSTGQRFQDLPQGLQDYLLEYCGPLKEENVVQHQTGAQICERHSLLRACNPQLSNVEYHAFLLQEADAKGFTYDELVWVLTEEAFSNENPALDLTKKGKGKRRKPCIYYFIK
jgi:hypothetical protein